MKRTAIKTRPIFYEITLIFFAQAFYETYSPKRHSRVDLELELELIRIN